MQPGWVPGIQPRSTYPHVDKYKDYNQGYSEELKPVFFKAVHTEFSSKLIQHGEVVKVLFHLLINLGKNEFHLVN